MSKIAAATLALLATGAASHVPEPQDIAGVVGEPLDLSPFVRKGDAFGAQKAAQVRLPGDPLNLTSYAGFVETTPGRHMFFWHFPAQNGDPEAPLLIWLQGGPGGSSLFGLFSEMGPYSLSDQLSLVPRPYTWNEKYSMLFIDNPVGAGFSYPDTDDGYCTNTKQCVADNLYALLQSFYVMFPDQMKVPLFITAESYGGHYGPAFAFKIHEENQKPDGPAVPLRGLAVGDGWIDPVNMIPAYPDMMYNFGLADEQQKKVIQDYCQRTVQLIQSGNLTAAFRVWDEMLNGDLYPYPNYFHNITGSNDYDNFLRTDAPGEFGLFSKYVDQPAIRRAMHTGNATFNSGHECELHLVADFHVSFASELITLLEADVDYRVFIYSGQLDIIIGAPLTEAFLFKLPWNRLAEYQSTERKIWYDNSEKGEDPVSGYVREVGPLRQIIIRGAGHIAPYDQPRRTRDMIDHLVSGKPF